MRRSIPIEFDAPFILTATSSPILYHERDFLRSLPVFSVSIQWGSWRKNLQEDANLRLWRLHPLTNEFLVPTNYPCRNFLAGVWLYLDLVIQCSHLISLCRHLSLRLWASWLPLNLSISIGLRKKIEFAYFVIVRLYGLLFLGLSSPK